MVIEGNKLFRISDLVFKQMYPYISLVTPLLEFQKTAILPIRNLPKYKLNMLLEIIIDQNREVQEIASSGTAELALN